MGRGRKPTADTLERIEYAKTHTRKEWAEHFNSSIGYANCFYYNKNIYYSNYNSFIKNVDIEEFKEFAKMHNEVEIMKKYNISQYTLHKVLTKNDIEILRYSKRYVSKENKRYCEQLKRIDRSVDDISRAVCNVCLNKNVDDNCQRCRYNYISNFQV